MTKKRRYQAANVIKFAVKSWYMKRHGKYSSIRYFRVQQKLFHSIKLFQNIRQNKSSLLPPESDIPEMPTTQPHTNKPKDNLEKDIINIKTDIKTIKYELNYLNRNLHSIQETLNLLVNQKHQ